jgi:hypothetical protein
MLNEPLLEEKLGALEAARSWSPRVTSRLEALLRSGAEEAVFRVNPVQFGADKGIAEGEAIDLFLHATLVGLMEMDWLVVCPMCSDVVESFRSLRTLHNHFHCTLCQTDYESVLDDHIAVTFTVAPAVRRIRFHDPDSLSAEDYAFVYKATNIGRTADGVPWIEIVKSLMRAMTRLMPGTTAELSFDAVEGVLLGFDMESDANFMFEVTGEPAASPQRVPVEFASGKCTPAQGRIAPGRVVFEMKSVADRFGAFGVLQFPPGVPQRGMLQLAPFLSGNRLLMTQTFRDFFRSEVIRASEGVAVRDVALLFTDLKGSTALYERIGDLNAYVQVQRHFERLLDVTLNERLDYFGPTVNIAARVEASPAAMKFASPEEVYRAPGVEALLAPFESKRTDAALRGIDKTVPVHCIGGRVG